MTHDDAALLIPEFLEGRLNETASSEVASHVASCGECSGSSEVYRILALSLRSDSSQQATGHPSNLDIVAYALDGSNIKTGDLARIASHVHGCPTCLHEVTVTREAEVAQRSRLTRSKRFVATRLIQLSRPGVSAALAAGVALIVLVYPAYLGVYRLPSVAKHADVLRAEKDRAEKDVQDLSTSLAQTKDDLHRAMTWSGAVDLTVLGSPLRDKTGVMTVRVAKDQPYVLIALQPPGPDNIAGTSDWHVEIHDSSGIAVWHEDLTAAQLQHFGTSGIVTFLIRRTLLPPSGRYVLSLSSKDTTREGSRLAVPFEIAEAE